MIMTTDNAHYNYLDELDNRVCELLHELDTNSTDDDAVVEASQLKTIPYITIHIHDTYAVEDDDYDVRVPLEKIVYCEGDILVYANPDSSEDCDELYFSDLSMDDCVAIANALEEAFEN